tara:strand:+ start:2061 stop:2396 length:336 start_codon:yes stop_codon:yes gene_type:complete
MVNIKMELERILTMVDNSDVMMADEDSLSGDMVKDLYGSIENLITDIDLEGFDEGENDEQKDRFCTTMLEDHGYIIHGDEIHAPSCQEDDEDLVQCLDYVESAGYEIIWND